MHIRCNANEPGLQPLFYYHSSRSNFSYLPFLQRPFLKGTKPTCQVCVLTLSYLLKPLSPCSYSTSHFFWSFRDYNLPLIFHSILGVSTKPHQVKCKNLAIILIYSQPFFGCHKQGIDNDYQLQYIIFWLRS